MIVRSKIKLEVNKIYGDEESSIGGITDGEGNRNYIPFFVLAEVTKDEYLTEHPEVNSNMIPTNAYFYKVSVD